MSLGLAPWSLAVTATENRTKGRWGSAHPTSETCVWAWRRRKAPELSCDRYREPDQGALGQCPPRQGDVFWAWRRRKAPEPAFKRQNLSPQNHTLNHFPTAPQTSFPNGPTSRVAVESEPTQDEAPSPACLGASDTLDVWPKPPFST
ncbi:hypothetical protein G5714_024574 [Onychostoma macrolepis]|uniref:Uncharacterized protein n=1 Tax=Onychostoma macrolepis TaxID=369639 RepID=A0A7J6BK34_9TELE|nr:hypothetical protein G5714_024574 [Onychostoma macrolepis]